MNEAAAAVTSAQKKAATVQKHHDTLAAKAAAKAAERGRAREGGGRGRDGEGGAADGEEGGERREGGGEEEGAEVGAPSTKDERGCGGAWYLYLMSAALPLFNPVLDAIDRAPVVRRLTPEQQAELAQDLEDLAAGRLQVIASEDMPAALEALRQQHSA